MLLPSILWFLRFLFPKFWSNLPLDSSSVWWVTKERGNDREARGWRGTWREPKVSGREPIRATHVTHEPYRLLSSLFGRETDERGDGSEWRTERRKHGGEDKRRTDKLTTRAVSFLHASHPPTSHRRGRRRPVPDEEMEDGERDRSSHLPLVPSHPSPSCHGSSHSVPLPCHSENEPEVNERPRDTESEERDVETRRERDGSRLFHCQGVNFRSFPLIFCSVSRLTTFPVPFPLRSVFHSPFTSFRNG